MRVQPPLVTVAPGATPPEISQIPNQTQQVADQVASLVQSGRPDEARQVVEQALKDRPNDPALRKIESQLPPPSPSARLQNVLAQARNWLSPRAAPSDEGSAATIAASPIPWVGSRGASPAAAAVGAANGFPGAGRRGLAEDGMRLLQLKDYQAAEAKTTTLILADPNNGVAYRMRALARRGLGRYVEALDDALKAVGINPKDGWSHNIVALILIDLKRPREAVAQTSAAIELNARDASAWATQAQAWRDLGERAKALGALEKAKELDPQFQGLYADMLREDRPEQRPTENGLSKVRALYAGAVACALLFFGLALLRGRTTSEVRQAAAHRLAVDRPAASGALAGFEIVRQIGQGGMGVVYEALDRALQRKVALKRMREEIAADPRERKRFLREARTVASLKHPNIVEIYSVVEQEGGLFLVFEHVNGETLDRVLKRKGKLSPAEALPVIAQIALGLDHAHGQGVIHQDLKPANIMVGEGAVKVMDFGIARHVQDVLSTMSRGEVAGTPAYMAPEQEQGRFQNETDVYAFGLCVYEMLCGRSAFPNGGAYMLKVQRIFEPLSRAAGLPAAVDKVLSTALHPDPLARHRCAKELVADLRQSLNGAQAA